MRGSKLWRVVAWKPLLALTVVAVAMIAGCSGRTETTTSTSPSSGSGTSVKVTRVAVITPEKANDFGWNQQGVDGAKAAAASVGAECIVQDGAGYGDITPILNQLAGQDPQLIYAWASGYNTVAPEVARQTGIPTVIVGAGGDAANVPGLVNDLETDAQNGAYLAGILAARMTKTATVAIVVSAEDENWTKMSGGFMAGARSVSPGIKILYVQIGQAGYADAAAGKRVTASAIAGGADVVFGMGDGSSFGMMQAVETETPPSGADKVWFIDVIGDKSSLDKKGIYLSSVVWDFTPLDERAITEVESGTFGSATYTLGLDNGIDLLQTRYIPADVWSAIQTAKQGILDGSISVPLTKTGKEVKAYLNSGQ
jgi:simple sugar transport system substrate-binding protein